MVVAAHDDSEKALNRIHLQEPSPLVGPRDRLETAGRLKIIILSLSGSSISSG
jgi:hypothetical protein